MKRLVLMRHAKAEPFNPGGDHARELSAKGRKDAAHAGSVLAKLNLDQAIVSSSARTRQTFDCLDLLLEPEIAVWLYSCGAERLLRHIGETPEHTSGLLVVGHSPTIPSLAARLAELSDPLQADELATWFPTSTFAEFTFDGSWPELASSSIEVKLEGVVR